MSPLTFLVCHPCFRRRNLIPELNIVRKYSIANLWGAESGELYMGRLIWGVVHGELCMGSLGRVMWGDLHGGGLHGELNMGNLETSESSYVNLDTKRIARKHDI